MISCELLREKGVFILDPEGPLESADFENLARLFDGFIEEEGRLPAVMISAQKHPGWKDFGGLLAHLKFAKEHRRDRVRKAAIVGHHKLLPFLADVVDFLVAHEVRHFDVEERGAALNWLAEE